MRSCLTCSTRALAARALESLHFSPLNGRPIRIMFSNRDPSMRRSGAANIFIKNLDKAIDNKGLHDAFASFGNVLSCKIASDTNDRSKGYGFIQFEQEEPALNTIEKLNGMLMNDKQVFVGPFLRRQERENSGKTKFNNVFVKNLQHLLQKMIRENLLASSEQYQSVVVMKEAYEGGQWKIKVLWFCQFREPR